MKKTHPHDLHSALWVCFIIQPMVPRRKFQGAIRISGLWLGRWVAAKPKWATTWQVGYVSFGFVPENKGDTFNLWLIYRENDVFNQQNLGLPSFHQIHSGMWRCVTETSECTKHAGGYLDIPTSTVSLCFTYAKNEPWTKSGFFKLLKYSYLTNIEAGPLEKFVSLLQYVFTRTWLRNQAISKDHHYHPQNSPKILNWSWKSDSDFCGSFVWGAPSRTTLQPGDSKPASSLPQKAPTVGGSSIFVSGHRFMGVIRVWYGYESGMIHVWPHICIYMYIYMYMYI